MTRSPQEDSQFNDPQVNHSQFNNPQGNDPQGNDPQLSAFLRQHKPLVPAGTADLEQHIMDCLDVVPLEPARLSVSPMAVPAMVIPWRSRRSLWVVSSTLAAGFVAAFVGYRALIPPTPNYAELADLETFIESTWDGSVSSQPAELSTPDELFGSPDDSTLN
jgi:hypothetical protein